MVAEILRSVSSGNSPVSGYGRFKRLSEDYADSEKGGDRTPNLELQGDMLDALEARNTREGVNVGIFAAKEVPKADGHNNFSGDSRLPLRRFIPKGQETFKRNINSGVKRIVQQYEVEEPDQQLDITNRIARTLSDSIISVILDETISIDEILGGDLFD